MGSKGTIPKSDAESVLDVIGQMLETGTFDSSHLPGDPVIRQRLDEIVVTIGKVQNFALCISKGDLECRLDTKGILAGSFKFLHSNLRHLTWQAQQIAAGDFSQRVDFMGEFSEAFNHMVVALEAVRAEMKQRELELSTLNAQLSAEVTVRRQAEEHLDQQFRFLQQLTDTIPNPIFYKDAKGVYTGCNTAFEKYIELPKDQIAGKSVYDISPKELADKYFAKDKELFDHPGTQIYESRVKYADGSIHDVIFNKATFSDLQGNVQGLVGVIVDITERKQAEEALQQANKKLNLLSSITRHDILNQLQVMKGYLELSRDVLDDQETLSEFLTKEEDAARNIERQIVFTKEYQDLGVKAPVWQPVDVCVKKAQESLPMRDIRVVTDCPDMDVFADPLFEKVFYNLIDNALRYGGPGMTIIRISSHESEKGSFISIEDDGVGISVEDKNRLFERGFGHHTGLGLFLSREILAITGITITEAGEPGKGARFEILVPKGAYRLTDTR